MAIQRQTAGKLAIDCIEKRQAVIAGNAHLYNHYKLRTPMCESAAKEFDRLEQAKSIINADYGLERKDVRQLALPTGNDSGG
jgi:hypothetical protein